MFLGIEKDEISDRFEDDLAKNPLLFLGLGLALTSSALDVITYFIIR